MYIVIKYEGVCSYGEKFFGPFVKDYGRTSA